MAYLGTWTSPYTGPTFKYDLYADIIARGSGTAVARITVDAYMSSSSSYFGYSLNGTVDLDYVAPATLGIVSGAWPLSGTTKRRVTYNMHLSGVPAEGATVALTFDGLRPGGEGNSGKIHIATSVAVGAYYTVPAAPTSAAASRVSDNQHTIGWTNNATAGAPYTNLVIDRWDNVTNAWYQVASIAGSATSWADTTTQANRRYQWRVKATNSAGTSSAASTSQLDSTPAAPSALVATKQTADVVLTWVESATNEVGVEVWESQDGGTYALLATTAADATTYTHVAASTAVTHRYKVRAKATTGNTLYSAYSAESEMVVLLAAPYAPANLIPSGSGVDGTEAVRLSWAHNPADGTGQTAYSLRYRPVGGSWVTVAKTTSGNQYHDLTAGTFTNGDAYEWEVQTWGQHADGSPWSPTAAFIASARPTATIVTPAVGVDVGSSYLTLDWVYADSESTPQSRFVVALYDEFAALIHSATVLSAESSYALPYTLADGADYTVSLTVYDGDGTASAEVTRAFHVAYLAPMVPALTTDFDPATGSVALMVTNPVPAAGEPAVAYNRILRSAASGWELLDGTVPADGAITDWTPPVGIPVTYRVEAVSATPTTATTDIEVLLDSQGRAYVNAGSDLFAMQLRVTVSADHKRQSTVEHYAGRAKPILYEGANRSHGIAVSGTFFDLAYRDVVERVLAADGPKMYRDPYGRRSWVAHPDGYRITHGRGREWALDISFTEVEQ